ncbi:ABC transporter permease [Salirhabdus salicampi]|uniref:ABC transporter permease n=1 Tax=Salirhabdus salicampi TaxID=476102 RepID=UPI0020C1EB30|nr:ABC transporter permease [Salirhabdus salicampi]MCP8615670.1 ABC transporter permease [Salirhabdus salicampi]
MSLFKTKEAGIGITLVILMIVLASMSPVFFTFNNLIELMRNNVVIAILAAGMTLVIITGGIDVSVAAITATCTVLVGNFLIHISDSVFLVLIASALLGTLLGAINGFFVAKIKIPPIVITLGTMSVFTGFTMYITGGVWITKIPQSFIDFGRIKILNIPIQLYFLLVIVILTWFILKYMNIGRHIYAIGGNVTSSIRSGIKIERVQMFVYSYVGFLAGIAAVVHTSIMRQVDPNAFSWVELQVIAAVVIGGASILGGVGSVWGSLLGVSLLAVLSNGLTLAHIPSFWHKIIVGTIILLAVSFDIIKRNRDEDKLAKIDPSL